MAGLGALHKETEKIYLMYSDPDAYFSPAFKKKASEGAFIDDGVPDKSVLDGLTCIINDVRSYLIK